MNPYPYWQAYPIPGSSQIPSSPWIPIHAHGSTSMPLNFQQLGQHVPGGIGSGGTTGFDPYFRIQELERELELKKAIVQGLNKGMALKDKEINRLKTVPVTSNDPRIRNMIEGFAKGPNTNEIEKLKKELMDKDKIIGDYKKKLETQEKLKSIDISRLNHKYKLAQAEAKEWEKKYNKVKEDLRYARNRYEVTLRARDEEISNLESDLKKAKYDYQMSEKITKSLIKQCSKITELELQLKFEKQKRERIEMILNKIHNQTLTSRGVPDGDN